MSATRTYVQVIDALTAGGAERTAVMIANELANRGYRSALVSTRADGPLRGSLSATVEYRCVARTGPIDLRAAQRMRKYVSMLGPDLVHAHGSCIHFTGAALAGRHRPAIIWHDHNPRLSERSARLARLARAQADRTLVVSQDILDWHMADPSTRADTVELMPNLVDGLALSSTSPDLPGERDRRVVVVANMRPEKNHIGTVRAFARVVEAVPDAHLLCVGATPDPMLHQKVLQEVTRWDLDGRVHILGPRVDVADVLAASTVAVLFSWAEGQSIALLEYGRAGLPTVASRVGSADKLAEATTGLTTVDAGDEEALAKELIGLLRHEDERLRRGADYRGLVQRRHSADAVIPSLISTYDGVIESRQ